MTTTDRMSNLDSRRETTDRTGQLVILGNSIGGSALNIIAAAVAGATGSSEVKVPLSMTAGFTMNLVNGSFGIWAVFWQATAVASLQLGGAAINNGLFNDIASGLLSWGADAMLLNVKVVTATQAYTPTAGTAKVVVVCVGAGGGGGGCAAVSSNNSAAGGGGAGSVAMGIITSGFSGVTVTVGTGGTGGAIGTTGATGGTTSFGSALLAGGGVGGTGDSAGGIARAVGGGAGGSSSGASSLYGSRGETGCYGSADTVLLSRGGRGGNSPYGSGGIEAMAGSPSSGAGIAATGFGAGGGGAAGANSVGASAGQIGGNGSNGLVIIYEYNA